jgi:hypothetical protein
MRPPVSYSILRSRLAAILLAVLLAGALVGPSGARAGQSPEADAAGTPAVVKPLSPSVRAGAPQIFARLPGCGSFEPASPTDGGFRQQILAMCRAVTARIAAGSAENVVDLYAAMQLTHYHRTTTRLASDRGLGDASAYLIARELKLFRIHRAMFGE